MTCSDSLGAQMLHSYLFPFDCISEKQEMFVFESQTWSNAGLAQVLCLCLDIALQSRTPSNYTKPSK